MKKLLALLFFVSPVFADGPVFQHKDTIIQQEFENCYSDIRKIFGSSGNNFCIDSPTFCVDAVNNLVTLASTTVNGSLAINGSVAVGNQLSVADRIFYAGGSAATPGIAHSGDTNTGFASPGNDIVQIITSGAVVSSFTASGEILQPLQPDFSVTPTSSQDNVTGDNTDYSCLWGTEIYDQGGDFASNTFTAPVTAHYQMNVRVKYDGLLSAHSTIRLKLITSNRTYFTIYSVGTYGYVEMPMIISQEVDMDANDTATVSAHVSGGTKVVDIPSASLQTAWSGYLSN
jgi:hypothetical protein